MSDISDSTRTELQCRFALCKTVSTLSRELNVPYHIIYDILLHRDAHVSRKSEQRVRRALGLPPLPALIEVPPCPDCGSLHHTRCHGNGGATVVLAEGERIIKATTPRPRKRYFRACIEKSLQPQIKAAGGIAAVVNAGLEVIEQMKINEYGERICDVCGEPFDGEEWEDRHTPHESDCPNFNLDEDESDMYDCTCDLMTHAHCCPECHPGKVKP